ncbi:MAG: hypothetical protein R6X25_11710 [Candidatus Krumholzibacteriia bacterium]
MRWIDIVLPAPGSCQSFDTLVCEARERLRSMAALQQREGLDSPRLPPAMADVGRLLFRAVQASDPQAFRPRPARSGAEVPPTGLVEADGLLGYHFVGERSQVGLPWTWLHSGVGFVLEIHPLSAGLRSSRVPEATLPRAWMRRYSDALFARWGGISPGSRCGGREGARPEILFVPGHGDAEIRRLIFREADGIRDALRAPGLPLADLLVPRSAVTPQQLAALCLGFQAIHYAGPTSAAPENGVSDIAWLSELEAAAGSVDDAAVEDAVGLEPDLIGVDQVDAILDLVNERYETSSCEPMTAAASGVDGNGAEDHHPGARARRRGRRRSLDRPSPRRDLGAAWLLDDGPVEPESLGRLGSVPPLIFSNSFCSLPHLAHRFLATGASTFVGPHLPLYSRPARLITRRFYSFLSDGFCAGGALRAAALATREELGPEHPAWLSYGVTGYGALALQFL